MNKNMSLIDGEHSLMAMSPLQARKITARAEAAILGDTLRTARTKMALLGAAEVAATEEYCLSQHPSGQAEYRRIAEAHNWKTLKSIVEEGW